MFRLSVSQFCSYRWSLFQDIVRYSKCGITGIGLWRRKLEDFGHDEAIDLLSEMQMDVSSLSWAGGFTGSNGNSFEAAVDDAIESIVLAHRLQANCLIVHPGGRNGHTNSHLSRLFKTAFRTLTPIAEDYGIRLAIEPCLGYKQSPFNYFDSWQQQVEAIQEFSPHQLGLVIDLYHVGENREPGRFLKNLLPRIALVQLADFHTRPSKEENRCLLGQGQVPIHDWLDQLVRIDYQGFVELELHGMGLQGLAYDEIIQSSQAFLNSLPMVQQWGVPN